MPGIAASASAVDHKTLRADTARRASQLEALLIKLQSLPLGSDHKLIPYFLGGLACLNDQGIKGTSCDAHTLNGVIHCLNEAMAFTTWKAGGS